MSGFVVYLGAAGLWLVEASYLPQIWRLFKLKEADEFSFLFPGLNIAGRVAGVIYTIEQGSFLLTWFFVVGITLRLILLGQVVFYRASKKRRPTAASTPPLSELPVSAEARYVC